MAFCLRYVFIALGIAHSDTAFLILFPVTTLQGSSVLFLFSHPAAYRSTAPSTPGCVAISSMLH
jgi:hypothetical protein